MTVLGIGDLQGCKIKFLEQSTDYFRTLDIAQLDDTQYTPGAKVPCRVLGGHLAALGFPTNAEAVVPLLHLV